MELGEWIKSAQRVSIETLCSEVSPKKIKLVKDIEWDETKGPKGSSWIWGAKMKAHGTDYNLSTLKALYWVTAKTMFLVHPDRKLW